MYHESTSSIMSANNETPENIKKLINLVDDSSQTRSLPLLNDFKTQLYTLGTKPSMECMPLRSSPYHYHHVVDQAKSLQELQNEVGALLEFRDLVIETFPDLKSKMASSQANSTITGLQSSSLLTSRREWEPGIRVRRKIGQKESNLENVSSLVRSRSNSHSNKQHTSNTNNNNNNNKEPKSGEGNGSVVQDSGFSTETSSSKETHSASSTTGTSQGASANNRLIPDTEDELWNLLDVIHRKSNRLRDEVEHLRIIERDKCIGKNVQSNQTFQNSLTFAKPEDVQILRKERDRLLDKLSEMEAETLSCKIKESKMQDEMEVVKAAKKDLEVQLEEALNQKSELNLKLNDLGVQLFNSNSNFSTTEMRLSRKTDVTGASNVSYLPQLSNKTNSKTHFTPVVLSHNNRSESDINKISSGTPLGHLDGLLNFPKRIPRLKNFNSKKIAAILLETNIVELQRHLLIVTVQNQVLQEKLEKVLKSKSVLSKQLEKSKEDIEDLKFQLEEKSIELEGARAQLRVIESKSLSKSEYGSPDQTPTRSTVFPAVPTSYISKIPSDSQTSLYRDAKEISTASMKAMIPLPMDDTNNLNNSSSTESAQDQSEVQTSQEMPKHRPPSKIPLAGQKTYVAPKPPSGKHTSSISKIPSGPPSNRSLSKSTGSLQGVQPLLQTPSPYRSESSQSWRNKDASLERQRNNEKISSGSSIPVSSTSASGSHNKTTIRLNTSPVLPRAKRDSLTSKVKNLDSLSRHMSQSSINQSTNNLPSTTTTSTTTLSSKSNNNKTKKDLSFSFTISNNNSSNNSNINNVRGNNHQPTAPSRRTSSSSVHRFSSQSSSTSINNQTNKIANNNLSNNSSSQQDAPETASDSNKVRGGLRANFWNWLKI